MEKENLPFEYTPDAIDLHILELLHENAKLATKEIANHVGLTVTPTFERIKRLERRGFIERYTVQLNKQKLGIQLTILCFISLQSHSKEMIETFEEKVVTLKEITQILHIAGNFDYQLTIEMKDMHAYAEFLKNKLASIPNIATVQSSFVLKAVK
jgi:DNA-binding Lrp family transcriptional regulator